MAELTSVAAAEPELTVERGLKVDRPAFQSVFGQK